MPRKLSSKSSDTAKPRARGSLQREQFEYYLGHFAQYDALTGLPNRGQFHDHLKNALARAARHGQMAGVMLLNIDSFKAINIKHGQRIGDLVLKEAAARLKQCSRASDTLARLGGDEFAMILEGLAAAQGAVVPAQRAQRALAQSLALGGNEIAITATIGIALFPAHGNDLDALLRTADAAMCDAKEHARGGYRFYSPELELQTRRDELRRAEIELKLTRLTPREREVLDILIDGKPNKMIAYLLGTSTRTIENHRASIMNKMQTSSLAELVRMVVDHRQFPVQNLPPSSAGT